jgi:hypothetical protein
LFKTEIIFCSKLRFFSVKMIFWFKTEILPNWQLTRAVEMIITVYDSWKQLTLEMTRAVEMDPTVP